MLIGFVLIARSTKTRFACALPALTFTVEKGGAPLFPPKSQPLVLHGTTLRYVLTVPAIAVRLMIAFSWVPSVGIVGAQVGEHQAGCPAMVTLTAVFGPIA